MEIKIQKLIEKCPAPEKDLFTKEMKGFLDLFGKFLQMKSEKIDWDKINPPKQDLVVPYFSLEACPEEEKASIAKKLCVLKLNGGLGTTMGCVGPKSVIEVHSEQTFLDLTVQQIEVILLDSFLTVQDH
jgi:UTP--glucose-1-phosphate uridylyltransferase